MAKKNNGEKDLWERIKDWFKNDGSYPEDISMNIRRFWQYFIGFIVFILLFFTAISAGLLGDMPSFEELENPRSNQASEIYTLSLVVFY